MAGATEPINLPPKPAPAPEPKNPTPADPIATVPPSIPKPPIITSKTNLWSQGKFNEIYAAAMTGSIDAVNNIKTNPTTKHTYLAKQHKYKLAVLAAMGQGAVITPVAPQKIDTSKFTPIMEHMPGTQDKSKIGKIKLKQSDLPPNPDFISSIAANVEANKKTIAKIQQWAMDGDIEAIKGIAPEPHPSKKVQEYKQRVIELMTPPEPELPSVPVPVFTGSIKELAKHCPVKKHHEVDEKFDFLFVIGKQGVIANHPYGQGKWAMNTHGDSVKVFDKGLHSQSFYELSSSKQEAVRNYTGGSYGSMNKSWGQGIPTGAALQAGKDVMEASQTMPEGMMLVRYFTLDDAVIKEFKKAVGRTIQQPSLVSTSVRKDFKWSGNVKMHIMVGPGAKGLYVSDTGQHPSEHEMILPPNSRFVIQGAEQVGDKLHVKAFMLPTESYQCC